MNIQTKKKGAPRKAFTHDEIEMLFDEFRLIPEEFMMAVDRGFKEAFDALGDSIFYQSEKLCSLDCLKTNMHQKLQKFSRVVMHRKNWYARLEVIKKKDVKKLNILEKQALEWSRLEGREAYIQTQKALKACIDADESRAKQTALARNLQNRAESLKNKVDRSTSPAAERRARTQKLCFYGATIEKFCRILYQHDRNDPISFLEKLSQKLKVDEDTRNAWDELFKEIKMDKRNPS